MIRVSSFGKTSNPERDRLISLTKKLIPFEWAEIPLKKCPDQRTSQLLPEENNFLKKHSAFYILDMDGKSFDSQEFYEFCFKTDRHFVIGPAIGFHSDFKKKAVGSLSLSSLTLTHGLAQLVLAESIYRSACILKNHPFVK